MTVSARLESKTKLALARYCKAQGLTKTQAIERGIHLLLKEENSVEKHSAYLAYLRLEGRLEAQQETATDKAASSSRPMRDRLDAKYPA
jgi:hypothetical protein